MEESIALILNALTGEDAFKYWAIPFIAAAVGYGTNWVAIKISRRSAAISGAIILPLMILALATVRAKLV